MTQPPNPTPEYAEHHPPPPGDLVRVGDFWIDSHLVESSAGVVYRAHADGSDPATSVHLRSGVASDPAARVRLSGEINAMHIDTVAARGGQDQDEGRMAMCFRDEDDNPIVASHRPLAPWVALAFSGSPKAVVKAQRMLAAVDPVHTPQLGFPAGSNLQMHWWQDIRSGTQRVWPFSWPGHKGRAGWLSLLTSFLLILLTASVAVLLVTLVFQNQQKVSPPAPVPNSGSATGSGSGSGSPSQSSGEPSSGESSPGEPSELESRSDTPSTEQPPGDPSGSGSPSPERKL